MICEAKGTVVNDEISGIEDYKLCVGDDVDGDFDGAGELPGEKVWFEIDINIITFSGVQIWGASVGL